MTLTLIDVFTFRFHSNNYDGENNGFQLEYSTQNCGDGTNNACASGKTDTTALVSFGRPMGSETK